MSNINWKNLFNEAIKIAGIKSELEGTSGRIEQERIAKDVKLLFEKLTDSIINNIDGWSHGKGSKQASIRPKGSNNNPFATSIWNFYKPDYINRKAQDKSLILIYVKMDVDKREIFASIGIHDRRNVKKHRENILDSQCINTVYGFIVNEVKTHIKSMDSVMKESFELEEERKFVYKKPIDDFNNVVEDFKKMILVLIDIYKETVKKFNFLEDDKECNLDLKSGGHYNSNGEEEIPNNKPLNQILYGPPGTGKTYNTINKALEIIFNIDTTNKIKEDIETELIKKADKVIGENQDIIKLDEKKKDEPREKLKKVFEYFKDVKQGQIKFITFHQSYGYEEFIEGIKAETTENENIKYEIKPGIFKRLCEAASQKKVFLDDLNKIDFNNYLKVNQVFTTKHGKKFIIKKIDEDITFEHDKGTEFVAYRKKIIEHIQNQKIMESDEYYSSQVYIAREIYKLLKTKDNTNKNYVLIIDEINRGNISKIFGELITLVEPSKRIGADEEIRVKLPYSGDEFGVPSNLYVIGTMNTADRSIAQIDTALRRRFEFIEMLPNYKVLCKNVSGELTDEEVNSTENNDNDLSIPNENCQINIRLLLKAINERIEYIYDREHQIGHSYFMPLINNPTKGKLDDIFRTNIIPLLAEYFYGDWADIKFVLNDTEHNIISIKEEKDLTFVISESKRRKNKIYNIEQTEFSCKSYQNIYATKKS